MKFSCIVNGGNLAQFFKEFFQFQHSFIAYMANHSLDFKDVN